MRCSLKEKATHLPRVGMRIVKSAVAVFLCFVFYTFFRTNGIIFYSQLAALWCIQPQWENTRSKALQRTVGTLTGAVFGLFVLLIDKQLITSGRGGELIYELLVALTIVAVIYVTLLLPRRMLPIFPVSYFLALWSIISVMQIRMFLCSTV